MSTQSPTGYSRGTDWRSRWMAPPPSRHVHDTETRPFFVTSEFLVYVLLLMGLAITAGSSPSIDARFFWQWATLPTIAYMLSRGVAKSGSRSGSWDAGDYLALERDGRRYD